MMTAEERTRQLRHRAECLRHALQWANAAQGAADPERECELAAAEARRQVRAAIEDMSLDSLRRVLKCAIRSYPA